MTVAAIIFDCDGVLIDSERIATAVLSDMLEDLGWPLGFEGTVKQFKGLSGADTVTAIEKHLGHRLPADFIEVEQQRCLDQFEKELLPIPGIVPALAALQLPRCVASSSSPQRLALSLGVTGLDRFFQSHVYSAHHVERGKPFPDLFLFAAQQIGAEPANCVVIEDSVPGVVAAVQAGMRVLGYSDLTPAEELCAAGAEVFHDMHALPALLPEAFGS